MNFVSKSYWKSVTHNQYFTHDQYFPQKLNSRMNLNFYFILSNLSAFTSTILNFHVSLRETFFLIKR
jgi:hypothetical protein